MLWMKSVFCCFSNSSISLSFWFHSLNSLVFPLFIVLFVKLFKKAPLINRNDSVSINISTNVWKRFCYRFPMTFMRNSFDSAIIICRDTFSFNIWWGWVVDFFFSLFSHFHITLFPSTSYRVFSFPMNDLFVKFVANRTQTRSPTSPFGSN
jgi:hypothetical protein